MLGNPIARPAAAALVLLGGGVGGRAAGSAAFFEIEPLDGAAGSTAAAGVSPDGSIVVGHSSNGTPIGEALVWTVADGTQPLPGNGPTPPIATHAIGLSVDGQVIVGAASSDGDPSANPRAFRWTLAGGVELLDDLPGGDERGAAGATSSDGGVTCGYGVGDAGAFPVRWVPAVEPLGWLDGAPDGYESGGAHDVSANGATIAGNSAFADHSIEAFFWTSATGLVGLGDLPGGAAISEAEAISADGATIIGHSESGWGVEAFVWTAALGMEGLGDLAGGNFASKAFGVSGDGAVVVGWSQSDLGTRPFVWTRQTGMLDLQQLMLDEGINAIAGWTAMQPTAISDDGTTVVGQGNDPNGRGRGWVIVLPPILRCFGDVDGDNDTDVFDFGVFATYFGQAVAPYTSGDFDGSGFVDVFDFSIFAADFGCRAQQFGR